RDPARDRLAGPLGGGLPPDVRLGAPLVLGTRRRRGRRGRRGRLGRAEPVGGADGADRPRLRRGDRRVDGAAAEPVRLDGVEDRQRVVGLVLWGGRNDRVLAAARTVPLGQVGGGAVALADLRPLRGVAAAAGVGPGQRVLPVAAVPRAPVRVLQRVGRTLLLGPVHGVAVDALAVGARRLRSGRPRSRGRRRRRGPGHRRRRGPGHRRGRRTVGLRRGGGRRFGGSGPGVGGGGAGALGPARVPQVLSAGRVLRRLLGPLRGARGRVGALGQSRRRAAAL